MKTRQKKSIREADSKIERAVGFAAGAIYCGLIITAAEIYNQWGQERIVPEYGIPLLLGALVVGVGDVYRLKSEKARKAEEEKGKGIK